MIHGVRNVCQQRPFIIDVFVSSSGDFGWQMYVWCVCLCTVKLRIVTEIMDKTSISLIEKWSSKRLKPSCSTSPLLHWLKKYCIVLRCVICCMPKFWIFLLDWKILTICTDNWKAMPRVIHLPSYLLGMSINVWH